MQRIVVHKYLEWSRAQQRFSVTILAIRFICDSLAGFRHQAPEQQELKPPASSEKLLPTKQYQICLTRIKLGDWFRQGQGRNPPPT